MEFRWQLVMQAGKLFTQVNTKLLDIGFMFCNAAKKCRKFICEAHIFYRFFSENMFSSVRRKVFEDTQSI